MSKSRFPTAIAAAAALLVLFPLPGSAQSKKSRDLIVRAELEQPNTKDKDLYEAIRSLRPHFLQAPRSNSSMRSVGTSVDQRAVQLTVNNPKPFVFIDGNKAGELDVLKNLQAAEVEEIRYMSPTQAGNEYGLGYEGGLILIKRIKPKSP